MTLTPANEIKVSSVLSDGRRALRVIYIPGGVEILWDDPRSGGFLYDSYSRDDLLETLEES